MTLVDARDGSDKQGQTFRKEVVWAQEGPGTIVSGGKRHSDGAKPVRQSPPLLGQEGDRHAVRGFDQYQVMFDGSRRLTEQKVPETVHSFSP
jgi:hypothetical protein